MTGVWSILSIFSSGAGLAGNVMDLATAPDTLHVPTHADGSAVSPYEITSDRWLKLSLLVFGVGIAWEGYLASQDQHVQLDWWVKR